MSQNNDNSGAAMGIAFVMAGLAFIAVFIFAVLAFLALVLTIVAIFAWKNPVTLFGQTTYPREARAFVWRGVAGAFLLPVFIAFCEMLFEMRFQWDQYGHFFWIGGYTLGSVGVEIMTAQDADTAPKVEIYDPPATPPRHLPQPPRAIAPPESKEPFRYASWDDEEEFK